MIIADPEILVVDDSVNDALLMRIVFARAGFVRPLRFAGDGEEAIAPRVDAGLEATQAQGVPDTRARQEAVLPALNCS